MPFADGLFIGFVALFVSLCPDQVTIFIEVLSDSVHFTLYIGEYLLECAIFSENANFTFWDIIKVVHFEIELTIFMKIDF